MVWFLDFVIYCDRLIFGLSVL